MSNSHTSGRRRELVDRGVVPPNTLITRDTYHLLLTSQSLTSICNEISARTGRKMSLMEVDDLTGFCARARESEYYQRTYAQVIRDLATQWLRRRAEAARTLTEENDNYRISGVSEDTDLGTISDYSRKELAQLTPNENQYKYTVFADRRGNAVIDRERVAGDRSSPDNIIPIASDGTLDMTLYHQAVYKMTQLVTKFIEPESTEKMFAMLQTCNTNYYNINLPRQIVQFDSRNRLPVNNNVNNYKWNLHTAGVPGQIGDVRVYDTIQQIIQLRLYPFWAPLNQSVINPYRKIRMLIVEFAPQSILVSEFNDPTLSQPTVEQYHFELEVQQISGDRMYLVPREQEFKFRKPMSKNFDTFTVHFRTPFSNEIFDIDSGTFVISYGNPTLFTITSPSSFSLNTGDLIYVYNSNSGSVTIDNEINNPQGQIITKLSNTQFTIPVDSSSLEPGYESNIYVYFGSKRLFFQIEFTCLEQ